MLLKRSLVYLAAKLDTFICENAAEGFQTGDLDPN